MNVQQAPPPVQAARLSPDTVALAIAQAKNGGTTSHSRPSTIRVSSVLDTELKRFRRSQSTIRAGPPPGPSIRPPRPPPGLEVASDGAVTTGDPLPLPGSREPGPARSALHQRHAPVVPVHEGREEQVDGEEHRHHDDDRLDLLARLVHH